MELIFALLAGTLLGLLTGLGIGGGSLLLLCLTGFLSMDPGTARGISLLFFFPAAILSALRSRIRIPFKKLLPALIPAVGSAVLFSLLARILDPGILKKALGLLFLLLGLREIFTASRKKR